MKKLLLLYISIIGFILPMWADFDPTKDTPPEVLPENIHPVQGKELNDKGVLGAPTFITNNIGVKYEWYIFSKVSNRLHSYHITNVTQLSILSFSNFLRPFLWNIPSCNFPDPAVL